ncbi:unnamed protein product [Didymodactylos carnosus]|uniref:Uncharacterized protein n=1 Tax=Didymodactylos carnosus TaxID=1234261 RepID=A0A815RE23_9BILA|nr:unnamed protein product [Didymodactylos carnosus]CAF1476282.1 unnamed protein product [Didymodactylos carnosus]CAF4147445.1 unnamed protein product [Didymodactylos carnosus]CAF4342282.1 unnamed protein product [Didymodactylos carnosus]
MDIVITAFGEFIWISACGIINFCVSSGISCLVIFVSLLCAIGTSAFYRWTLMREKRDQLLLENQIKISDMEEPPIEEQQVEEQTNNEPIVNADNKELLDEENNDNEIVSVDDIQINESDTTSDVIIDTIEGTEEEIRQKQLENICRLLNEQNLTSNWSTIDFLDQLRMYGLHDGFEPSDDELAV